MEMEMENNPIDIYSHGNVENNNENEYYRNRNERIISVEKKKK